MATPTPEPKKRKLSTMKGGTNSIPNNSQTKVASLKANGGLAHGNLAKGEDTSMQTPPIIDPTPKLTEFNHLPPPSRPEPFRAFEIGDLAKLSLLSGPQSSKIIVKIMNHALPSPEGTWQYCLKADSIMPGGTGVLWVDENNLQKVNSLDISKGATVQFVRGDMVMNGIVKEAKLTPKTKELIYEVEYACSAVVGMRDILRVTGHGIGD